MINNSNYDFQQEFDEYYPMKDSRHKTVKGVTNRTGKSIRCIDFFHLKENDNKLYSDNGKFILYHAIRCDVCKSRQCMDQTPRKNVKTKANRDILMNIRYDFV
jgi:hypothetical protein